MNSIDEMSILGVNIAITNQKEVIDFICANIIDLKGKYICVSNVHTTVMSYENEEYKNIQNSAVLRLPDGNPLCKYERKRGYKNAQRVDGPNLMNKMLSENDLKFFFYGSSTETLNKMKDEINSKYPNAKVVGMISPPFRDLSDEEDKDIINQINDANPDIVFVGLGAPKQEKWMYNHQNKINGLMIGVGAAFDFCAGNIKRAPKWMQRLSLEWFYRMMQDPKRLFKRYFFTNTKFLWLTFRGK